VRSITADKRPSRRSWIAPSIGFHPAFPSPRTPGLWCDPAELRELLGRQVVSPVRWIGCARALAAAGATTFVEAGPGDVLTKLAKRVVPEARAVAIGSPEAAGAFVSGG
jgi:malonyl CoA-acyl carrier protein transacylase